MANLTRNFITGRMNKMVDERLVPNGEYINALNIRMGSTEGSEIGVIENSKGNSSLTSITYDGQPLSGSARCIGAFEDGAEETIYWFVHDSDFFPSPTGKLDLILSFDTKTNSTTYHIISVNDGNGVNTTLNFDDKYLITGVNKIEDLLFFTDNLNQPKQINVKRNYANPSAGVDGFSKESVLVIKKPPFNSPSIKPIATSSQDNFLEDRYISFAYRYRYEDGEYSATSQFSAPSFLPNVFNYDFATALNRGMLNSTNMCEITYNTGGKLVKSIDLLFKDMNTSVIKIIEKLDKSEIGLADNTEYTYTFNNNKIFTILPDSEILRLYDNVPRLAQAQTLMGKRLVYGNYVEGYPMKDANGVPTKLEYFTTSNSESIGLNDLAYKLVSGNYSFDSAQVIPQSIIEIDLTGQDLIAGGVINMLLRFEHYSWSGQTPFPTEESAEQTIDFTYILPTAFTDVYSLATSVDFQEKIGTALNIETVANSCNGLTLTDAFNCIVPNELSSLFKYRSGISAANQPIEIITSPASSVIGLQLPTMEFVDDPTGVAITQTVYEYYSISTSDISYQEIGDPSSLHSNRGYEIGIVYMDEFNRSSTALVSPNNTVHIPCSASDTKNTITVNIPTAQVAPSWASRYKFCIKPDKKDYDVIYSNLFFRDPTSGADYFLLEGQNSQKVEVGDELIVKTDTQGARSNCTWTTVLDKEAKQRDFLSPPPVDSEGTEIPIPAGTYMKLRANNFSTVVGELPVVAYGEKTSRGGGCRDILYPVDTEDPNSAGTFIDYTLPAGTRVRININNDRPGNLDAFLGNVGPKYWSVDTTFTASQDYDNFKDWFDGDNIAAALESQATDNGTGVTGPNYNPIVGPLSGCNVGSISTRFYNNGTRTYFAVRSSEGYSGGNKRTELKVDIEVIRSASTVIFESDAKDAEPDLWYESSTSFGVGPNGEHLGNVQNQSFVSNTPALILTDFFNCYAFGNGAESYKIQDSIVGKELTLGNRALTTDSKLYSEESRFADLTYSGVYNTESNINKLNEFNLGLLNFKTLEISFGPVQKLFARETDILTLQEDKISYVLAGKNLLSDAAGGSALTSVPEVLGTQIARVEEFGISHNPESFSQWGADKYFTDAKRGAVIQLKGSSAQSDSLRNIARDGMRTWFRDLFNTSFKTQKLGGFDPYMNEYVLSSNDNKLPQEKTCVSCGITKNIKIDAANPYNVCHNLGDLVGDVNITYEILEGSITIDAVYDGNTFTTGKVSSSGVLTFDKDSVLQDTTEVSIIGNGIVNLTVACPDADEITIVMVQVSSNNDSGETIHNEYRWTDNSFISPLHDEQVTFQTGTSPVVSLYQTIVGQQGGGVIPSNTAFVQMRSNKIGADTFDFDITSDRFKYLRTDTVYGNNPTDIAALLAASSNALPINVPSQGNTAYEAQFAMPNTGSKLYLIWDYRNSTIADLCFGATRFDSCCSCEESSSIFTIQDCETGATFTVDDTFGTITLGSVVQYVQGVGGSAGTFVYCGTVTGFGVTPNATLYSNNTQVCGDVVNCNFESSVDCTEYTVSTSGSGAGFSYTDCDGNYVTGFVGGASGYDAETFCAQTGTVDASGLNVSNNGTCNY